MFPKSCAALVALWCVSGLVTASELASGSTDTWSGCSAGMQAGVASQASGTVYTGTPDIPGNYDNGSNTATGILAGGHVGCDIERGRWVLGLQGRLDAANLDGNNNYFEGVGLSETRTQARWLAALSGRIGLAVTPATLVYARIGVARVRNAYTDRCVTQCSATPGEDPSYLATADASRNGWLAGAGMAHQLGKQWSVFAEYQHLDFGSARTTVADQSGSLQWQNAYRHDGQTVTVGMSYRIR